MGVWNCSRKGGLSEDGCGRQLQTFLYECEAFEDASLSICIRHRCSARPSEIAIKGTDLEGGLGGYTSSEEHTCTSSGLSDRLSLHLLNDLSELW